MLPRGCAVSADCRLTKHFDGPIRCPRQLIISFLFPKADIHQTYQIFSWRISHATVRSPTASYRRIGNKEQNKLKKLFQTEYFRSLWTGKHTDRNQQEGGYLPPTGLPYITRAGHGIFFADISKRGVFLLSQEGQWQTTEESNI